MKIGSSSPWLTTEGAHCLSSPTTMTPRGQPEQEQRVDARLARLVHDDHVERVAVRRDRVEHLLDRHDPRGHGAERLRDRLPRVRLVPGGVLAGALAPLRHVPHARAVAVEPEHAPTLNTALAKGGPVEVPVSGVAADSPGATVIGDIAYTVAVRTQVESVLVSEAAIHEARRFLWDNCRLAVEHGTASALAALLTGAYKPQPTERLAVIICGANTDPADLATRPTRRRSPPT